MSERFNPSPKDDLYPQDLAWIMGLKNSTYKTEEFLEKIYGPYDPEQLIYDYEHENLSALNPEKLLTATHLFLEMEQQKFWKPVLEQEDPKDKKPLKK